VPRISDFGHLPTSSLGKLELDMMGAHQMSEKQVLEAILAEAGATLDDAVACTVHMTDLNEFQEMNRVYAEYFHETPPGRTTVQVAALPGGAHIEITISAVI